MPNTEHLAKLREGVAAWNSWRSHNSGIEPDLRGFSCNGGPCLDGQPPKNLQNANLAKVDLTGADLVGADLVGANLSGALLREANLTRADLTGASLRGGDLTHATLSCASVAGADFGVEWLRTDFGSPYLSWTDLTKADLRKANARGASFARARLANADLSGAHLDGALLVGTNLRNAKLTGCSVYGIAAWGLDLEGATQSNLVITPDDEPVIQVDNLEIAQFVYLLLTNQKIRHVIDTVTSKLVLILGRFTEERQAVLEAIRSELRMRDYVPVLFDFEKPDRRNLTETVRTLAHLARFVIADITDAKSIPQELMAIVPHLPHLPVQPVLLASQQEYGMFKDLRDYPWVLAPVLYDDQETLLAELSEKVIAPAEAKARAHIAKPS